jgi:hypothetical protein
MFPVMTAFHRRPLPRRGWIEVGRIVKMRYRVVFQLLVGGVPVPERRAPAESIWQASIRQGLHCRCGIKPLKQRMDPRRQPVGLA